MILGTIKLRDHAWAAGRRLQAAALSFVLATVPQAVLAAAPAAAASAPTPGAILAPAGTTAGAAAATAGAAPAAAGGYVPMTPTPGKGMPVADSVHLQDQYSPLGEYARWIHDGVLMPIIILITLLVLGLLLWVMIRYNAKSHPVPSRTSHNTVVEVLWTLLPVLILVGIAIPSIDLLAKQYKPAPAKALTIKATGNQWFWSYTYPDNGGFEIVSNMLNLRGQPPINNGVREAGSQPYDGPEQLEVDNRMVVPAGEPIRVQVTAADVIHSFAVPSLWFKIDAVPGRINEKVLLIDRPGVYYGQCSELCGARHAFMPIAVEALPRPQFNAWVLAQAGGVIDNQPVPAVAPGALSGGASAPAAEASAGASGLPPAGTPDKAPDVMGSAAPATAPSAPASTAPTPAPKA